MQLNYYLVKGNQDTNAQSLEFLLLLKHEDVQI